MINPVKTQNNLNYKTEPALISCIVPVFNGEKYLQKTLDSILDQSYNPLEIIVVDDGSTDKTAEIVKGYNAYVSYLWQPNKGPASARNLGLNSAKGEFVTFLDSDDLWHPEKLKRQIDRFHSRPELDTCVTHVQNFWIDELSEEKEKLQNHPHTKPIPGYFTGSLMARRAVFEKIGLFNDHLKHTDDTEWFLRAYEHNVNMKILPDVLVYRRIHQNNRSRLKADASRDEYLGLIKALLNRRRAKNSKSSDIGLSS